MAHLRALLILLVCFIIGTLGTPGIDFMKPDVFRSEKDKQAAIRAYGHPWGDIAIGAAALNREYRVPLVRKLEPLQRPPRISQNWSLYRDGPGKQRRLEVWVDDELKYRSVDAEHAWLGPQLRSRRVRPMVESTTIQYDSPNWQGLARYITDSARRDFPSARVVRLVATEGPFGARELKPRYEIVSSAPDWNAERRWIAEPPKADAVEAGGSEP